MRHLVAAGVVRVDRPEWPHVVYALTQAGYSATLKKHGRVEELWAPGGRLVSELDVTGNCYWLDACVLPHLMPRVAGVVPLERAHPDDVWAPWRDLGGEG